MFRRRWFVLHDNMLYWYKSSLEVRTYVQCDVSTVVHVPLEEEQSGLLHSSQLSMPDVIGW